MIRERQLHRIRTIPFASARAQRDARIAARRAVRTLRVAGATVARCRLGHWTCSSSASDDTPPRSSLTKATAIECDGVYYGALQVEANARFHETFGADLEAIAQRLGWINALCESARTNDTCVLSSKSLHDVRNVLNTVSMTASAIKSLTAQQRFIEVAHFVDKHEQATRRLLEIFEAVRTRARRA